MEKFICGNFYDDKKTNVKEKILTLAKDPSNRFALMMSEYLEAVYEDEKSSIITQWNLYNAYILPYEKIYNKFVWEFSIKRLEAVLSAIPTISGDVKASAYSLVSQYFDWVIATKEGLITFNLAKAINKEEIRKVSAKALQKKVIGLSQFWRMIKQMDSKIGNKSDLLPLVFGRYGIVGTDNIHILEANIQKIDRENLVYSTMDKDEILVVPIDQKFIRFCDSVVEENELNSGKANLIVEDITEGVLYGRLAKAFKLIGVSNMKIRDLQKSRLLDILFMTRMERKLITTDFRDVLKKYYPNSSAGRYMSYVKWYENLTDEKVESIKYVKSEKDLEDPNGVNAVLELKDRLNFN